MKTLTLLLISWIGAVGLQGAAPCRIQVIEKGSGWPVPLVELRTTHGLSFFTDNAGIVAIDAPDLLGREVFFHVSSDGYEVPKDGFGFRGVRLEPTAGGKLKIEVQRTMVARRVGRITGAGLFAESQRTGQDLDWKESGVFGCDSVQTVLHENQRYWVWGDTTLPKYPLGLFDSLGAISTALPFDRLEPPLRPALDFFRDTKGQLRGVTPFPGEGPTWATAMVSLPDDKGRHHLVCSYMKIRGDMDAYEWGLGVWNESKKQFERAKVLWSHSREHPTPPMLPQGHAVPWTDKNGKQWVLFCHPFPTLKCPATFEAWQDPSKWEALQPQTELQSADKQEIVRPHNGVHCGGMAWNAWRGKWITVFQQAGGKPSFLGELWYAESDQPTGPWGPAVKVLTHQHYTFYNPCLHPDFSSSNAPTLFFEGTYTRSFSSAPAPTPRYDYNQILYRLDLDDPRLTPAHARSP